MSLHRRFKRSKEYLYFLRQQFFIHSVKRNPREPGRSMPLPHQQTQIHTHSQVVTTTLSVGARFVRSWFRFSFPQLAVVLSHNVYLLSFFSLYFDLSFFLTIPHKNCSPLSWFLSAPFYVCLSPH